MPGQDGLCVAPLVHAGLLLDHQVPDVLPVCPAQLGQRGLASPGLGSRLGDERTESRNKIN